MSVGTAQLSESLQTLIDARLDTIDRMLLGRVTRQDRLAIVREVESQIFELLHERDGDDLTREDVLAVLARLDPPEAYLPETDEEAVADSAATRPRIHPPTRAARKPSPARVSGILALVALVGALLFPLVFILAELSGSVELAIVLLGGVITITLIGSVLAIIFGVVGRRGGAWAIVGIVVGGFSLLLSLCAAGYLVLLIVSM